MQSLFRSCSYFSALLAISLSGFELSGQTLEKELLQQNPTEVAKAARTEGDATRGAIAFFQPTLNCNRCHNVDGTENGLGPNLLDNKAPLTDAEIVEAILQPSTKIREGFESTIVQLGDGSQIAGVVVGEANGEVSIKDFGQNGKVVEIEESEIEARNKSPQSLMPEGLANQLNSRQQFLDLIRYVLEIREGGLTRAKQLQPPPHLVGLRLPEYESHVDHAGLIRKLDAASFERGKTIYNRLCINCHGTATEAGSLPTSLKFASGKFKNGFEPYKMYQTLTVGFGQMVPQTWMVPQQKYDVIHYIREEYLKEQNPSQYFSITDEYVDQLPKGDTFGPEPVLYEPWVLMNYGNFLTHTYEVGTDGSNFAYKGIGVRLDPGPGGISRGSDWMIFDHDTMRMSAAWSGEGFIDWRGVQFDGGHGIHPRVKGKVLWENKSGPGWADPETGSFADDQRVVGRDGRKYGPLPRDWATYLGHYQTDDGPVFRYRVGASEIHERAGMSRLDLPASETPTKETGDNRSLSIFTRQLEVGPSDRELVMSIADLDSASIALKSIESNSAGFSAYRVGNSKVDNSKGTAPASFDGHQFFESKIDNKFPWGRSNVTLHARIRTEHSGSICALASEDPKWIPNGQSLFIRDGKLVYDVGWVGAVESRKKVNDGKWHDVVARIEHESGKVELFIDGKLSGSGTLKTNGTVAQPVFRVGFTSNNFPDPTNAFVGDIEFIKVANDHCSNDSIQKNELDSKKLIGAWEFAKATQSTLTNRIESGLPLTWQGEASAASNPLLVGYRLAPSPDKQMAEREPKLEMRENKLCLVVPAGSSPSKFVVWTTSGVDSAQNELKLDQLDLESVGLWRDWSLEGSKSNWPDTIETVATIGTSPEGIAVDILNHPDPNPYLAQMRLTGLDFFANQDQMAVTTWDGDVWLVSGLKSTYVEKPSADGGKQGKLQWRRIASGLFQPLGIKIVNEVIYLTCRDQLVILRDLNGDLETDFYECFNNDQQVTEHFHEFAMGLQRDDAGNFYYAKSARHALTAVVPHHGTLLRVSPDGSETTILATGFRAANGVCLNPDGSFVVTDQEGHWNPKNRINWVEPGKFYGNMFGYHNVTDSSDSAMTPPICWITNKFDRSPAELLWVPEGAWGPLSGKLLNLSYGYGRVFVVPFEDVRGTKQGGMCALPIADLPTGVMRGRFNPADQQLYACGMFAWAGSATQPGGLYRLRYTGARLSLPVGLHAKPNRMEIELTEEFDPRFAADPKNYSVTVWDLKRTANYGSEHYNERKLTISLIEVDSKKNKIALEFEQLKPTWGMEIKLKIKSPSGEIVERVIHNSVFKIGEQ